MRPSDGIRPQINYSGDEGNAERGALNGLDVKDNEDDDDDESEAPERVDSDSSEGIDSDEESDSNDSIDSDEEPANNSKVEAEDVDIVECEVPKEAAPIRVTRNPADPTPEERAKHDLTHLPARPWCPVCVEARATEDPHYKQTSEEKKAGLAQICSDYCEIGENEADKTDKQCCIVARDRWTQAMHAALLSCKGTGDETAAIGLRDFIYSTGYTRLELKTDGEPALVEVANTVKEICKAQEIVVKNPPAHDPKANGVAERAVREFKEQLRATKIALERRVKAKLDPKLPLLHWMVVHSVETINRFLVGADGRTPYYRLYNKHFTGKLLEFGEMVWAKPMRKSPRKRSLKPRVVPGIWLGIHPKTGEHRVALLEGGPVIRVRTVLRRPDSEKWNLKELHGIIATPRRPNPKNEHQKEPNSIRETKGLNIGGDGSKLAETPVQEPKSQGRRDFRITKTILEKFGHTTGCVGCEVQLQGGKNADHRNHTALCRMRLEAAMQKDDELKERIQRRNERIGLKKSSVPEANVEPSKDDDVVMGDAPEGEVVSSTKTGPETQAASRASSETPSSAQADSAEPPETGGEEPGGKRQRLSLIEESAKNVIGHLLRTGVPEAGLLCKKEAFQQIIRSLDESWTRKIAKKILRDENINLHDAKKEDNISVAEVYSPPRMTKAAEKLNMKPEFALDLSTIDEDGNPWDFSSPKIREKALRLVDSTAPKLLILSPPCTMFSTMQNLNFHKMNEKQFKARMEDAIMHFAFAVLLCIRQAKARRLFLLEHPVGASSWSLKMTKLLSAIPGVRRVNFDFCMLGMLSKDNDGIAPAKKRTSIMTNSLTVAQELEKYQCDGAHRHVILSGEKCRKAQIYPEQFCKAILTAAAKDIYKQTLEKDVTEELNMLVKSLNVLEKKDVTEELNMLVKSLNVLEKIPDFDPSLYEDFEFIDDVSYKCLDKELAIEARRLEIDFFRTMKVYKKVPRHRAAGKKIITTRWIDINKGDSKSPNYRARLVGRELKLKDRRLDLFAATPPLESLRLLCSLCASNQYRPDPYRIISVDVRRAYFYAEAKREVFIEIPLEDWEPGDEHNVAQLNLSLYGTRDAAQNWAEEFTRTLEAAGFLTGKATPCNFAHSSRELQVTVHGDDFVATGPTQELQWFQNMMKAKYDIKVDFLGPQTEGFCEEIRVLNRTIRWTSEAIEYEPDARHVELILKQVGVECCKPVSTPGCTDAEYDEASRDQYEHLCGEEATQYRAVAARLNYLALDRPDIQFATKEIAKHMSRPVTLDWVKLKRLARYLAGKPRYVQVYQWQSLPARVDAFADSDWAGDKVTRKSTSGGILLFGSHLVKSWSSSQPIIALSSGEAELYAMVKATSQATGLLSMLYDYGHEVSATVYTDSTAAIGIAHRKGLGKTRHIQVQYLWIQEKISNKELEVQKIGTHDNPADIATKNLKAEILNRHIANIGGAFPIAQTSTALTINALEAGKVVKDAWHRAEGQIVRMHRKPREALFTPMKVAGGPLSAGEIFGRRLTIGRFMSGKAFILEDNWKTAAEPHRRLEEPWTGTTLFTSAIRS